MDKGTLNQIFFRGQTARRIPKLVTLGVASCVFFAMVSLDASASTSAPGDTNARLVESAATAPVSAASNHMTGFRTHVTRTRSLTFGSRGPKLRSHTLSTHKPISNASLISHFTGSSRGGHKAPTPTHRTTITTTAPAPPTTTTTPPPTTTTTAPPTTTTTPPPTTTTTAPPTTTTTSPPTTTTTAPAPSPNLAYPIGVVDSSEPSGYAPPPANALAGFTQSYVTDFPGTTLPSAWGSYEGSIGGDPGAQYDQKHVTVGGGMLQFNTYQDPAFNNAWITGGACDCNLAAQTHGAWFVRSRLTGPGATEVELLVPDANVWPPELDFNESYGDTTDTSATTHYGAGDATIERTVNIDLNRWHTWGLIWTPTSLTYTVDGNVWGTVDTAAAVPTIPMHLSLQQQTWCASNWACPTANSSLNVDWVAQYTYNN
jgi:hypothetical protein